MKNSSKILIVLFLLAGVLTIYMGLNVNLECTEATVQDDFLAGLPLSMFGAYCLFTSLFLWGKPQTGNILAVITITAAAVMLLASIFDLSIPIIKTSCV